MQDLEKNRDARKNKYTSTTKSYKFIIQNSHFIEYVILKCIEHPGIMIK